MGNGNIDYTQLYRRRQCDECCGNAISEVHCTQVDSNLAKTQVNVRCHVDIPFSGE